MNMRLARLGTALAAAVVLMGGLSAVRAALPAPVQLPAVADVRLATPEAQAFFTSFFTAKSRRDVAGTMSHFAPEVATYTDAVLGWPLDGYGEIERLFARYMPTWPASARSYPTRILGDRRSALVAFTDTPELFGDELRILGAVDFDDHGRVIRWVDYWDGSTFDAERYAAMRTPPEHFPRDFKETVVGVRAAPAMVRIASALQGAFARGDAAAAAGLLSDDAVYEDMTLKLQLLGRRAIERYLEQLLAVQPFGTGSKLRHVVGDARGGGFEWLGSPATAVAAGITALELDASGRITRLTTVYDGRQLLARPAAASRRVRGRPDFRVVGEQRVCDDAVPPFRSRT